MALCAATAAIAVLMTSVASSFILGQAEFATEQIETGRVRLPGGADIVYRIRLLPPASFPALPRAVIDQLEERKCMIPQTYEAKGPENVVHASLERKESSDWAVLCSVNGATTLYVFFQSQPGSPIALRKQRNTEWLGSEALGAYGSAWGIARRSPSQVRQTSAHAAGSMDIDHDGIEDAFVEKSSTMHYFHNGSWITLEPPN